MYSSRKIKDRGFNSATIPARRKKLKNMWLWDCLHKEIGSSSGLSVSGATTPYVLRKFVGRSEYNQIFTPANR